MKYFCNKKLKIFFVLIAIFFVSFIQTESKDINIKESKKQMVIKEYINNNDNSSYQEDELVVKIDSNFKGKIRDLEEKYSSNFEYISDNLYTVKFNLDDYTFDEMINSLNNEEVVNYAEPNYYFELAVSPTTEPSYDSQWALYDSDFGINLMPVWNEISGNEEVTVAVVDTGVKYDHTDLNDSIWINNSEIAGNSVDDDNNGYIDDYYGWNFADGNNQINDTNGHGTHVAGIIGAEINDVGVAGVVPNVKVMSLKVISSDGNIYLSDVISAINYATSKGVKIFNFSFGGDVYIQSFKDLLESKDALFICAAGNGGKDQIGDNNDVTPFYPSSYDLNNIISVAATDINGNLASFSNYGFNSVDVAAPGQDIYSTYNVGGYVYLSGTSMAAPFVTATAALLSSSDSRSALSEVRDNIISGVKDLPSLNGKLSTSGLIDIKQTYNNFMNIVEFDSGDGSLGNPYMISNARQLNAIRNNLSASYKLSASIDLSGYEWMPIGTETEPFTGTFDGSGYEISNLNIDLPNDSYIGFFGYVTNNGLVNPNIFNLKLDVVNINGNGYIGSLIGYGEDVNLNQIYVTTKITASSSSTGYIGGIVGYADNSNISNSSVSGIISGIGGNIGGLVGYLDGDINYSYSDADIYGDNYIGGIVGYIVGNIQNVYSLGSIIGDTSVRDTGGIVGYLFGNLSNSYSLGMLKLNLDTLYTNVGLLVGSKDGNVVNSYYYNPYNFTNNDIGNDIPLGSLYNMESYTGFDFDSNWQIGVDILLPTLKNINFTTLTTFSLSNEMSVDLNEDSKKIEITCDPLSNSRSNYLYTSEDTNIAKIDKFGIITPISEGTTTINVYSIELNQMKTIILNVTNNVKGDLNNDHIVTTTDLVILRRYLAGLVTINDELKSNADINGDKSITTTDLVRLRRYLAGLEEI